MGSMKFRWQNLLAQIGIAQGKIVSPCSEAEILEVETSLEILLPSEFKAFS